MTPFLNARDVAALTSGALVQGSPEVEFTAVTIDTREVEAQNLFFAIRGPNHDAHRFLDSAVRTGAAGLVVERGRAPGSLAGEVAVVEVDDTTRALGALAAGHRARFGGPVVAITGSSGKTTTKELCAEILSARAPCLRTRGNLNNEFGVPLTLLARRPEHQAAVVELGMNHRGEIAALAKIARPTVALVTNVGTAHIEHLGSQDAIEEEKGDLFAALGPEGIAAVNRDDPRVARQAERAPGRVLGYGRHHEAELRALDVRYDAAEGVFSFQLVGPAGDKTPVRVPGLSETTVINALGASAAALAAGATSDDVASGLARYRPVGGRMRRIALENGVTLIDDSYNANPQSMRAALEALTGLARPGQRVAVLGDMGELGETADEAHEESGRLCAELGIDQVLAYGPRGALVVEAARRAGLAAGRARHFDSHESIASALADSCVAGQWVLVKGSRAMHMERVVELLEAGKS